MDEDQWSEYKQRSRAWAVRIGFILLHSDAYREMNYAPALKLLTWFHEKIRMRVNKGKRGKNRYEIINGQEIAFTYAEAKLRGLSSHQISKGLKELCEFGFIDIKQPGSALRGDWTKYSISDRWKNYGTPNFKKLDYRKSIKWRNFGFQKRDAGKSIS